MRRLALSFLILVSLLLPVPAFAQGINQVDCSGDLKNTAYCQGQEAGKKNTLFGPDGIMTRIAQILIIAAGVISVVMVIIGGYRFIFSGGEPQKVAQARNTIIYACVGIVIVAISQAIVLFVLNKVG